MYGLNEIDQWRQHREDLVREAEGERLARRLRASRPKRASRLRDALFGQVQVAGNLRAEDSRCA